RTPPKLVAAHPLVPAPDATDIAITTWVTASFDEDLANVDANTFFLRDATGTRVAGDPAGAFSEGKQTAAVTLKPRAPLARSMRYTATLTNAITDHPDKPGDATNAIYPVEWSFTTVPRDHMPPAGELAAYGFREQTGFFGHNAPRWAS